MLEFRGMRKEDGETLVMYQEGGEGSNGKPTVLHPGPSLLLANHSPTGFEWGYLGSGPSQLSLAIGSARLGWTGMRGRGTMASSLAKVGICRKPRTIRLIVGRW